MAAPSHSDEPPPSPAAFIDLIGKMVINESGEAPFKQRPLN